VIHAMHRLPPPGEKGRGEQPRGLHVERRMYHESCRLHSGRNTLMSAEKTGQYARPAAQMSWQCRARGCDRARGAGRDFGCLGPFSNGGSEAWVRTSDPQGVSTRLFRIGSSVGNTKSVIRNRFLHSGMGRANLGMRSHSGMPFRS
jgi:hypothetical protein